jgi:acyl-CoA synthetase (NDP forming)
MGLRKADLAQFFHPRSIAIVGVSRNNSRLGGLSYLNKFKEYGFPGKLYPINPKATEILGIRAYPDLSSLSEVPDLAIVCVTARQVPAILEECARIGLRHIHILSSGFKELGTQEGNFLEQRISDISNENSLLVIGPNCMGPYSPSGKMTPWGAIPGMSGPLGIISQSGGLTQRLTEYTASLGVGVEKAVSMGNGAVLSTTDYLEFMARDDKIRVIALYLEGVRDGTKLFRLAREVSPKKPIILWKGGETAVGASTATSHTGGMAGEMKIWEAFCRQTGLIRVNSMEEWVDAIMAFSFLRAPTGKGVFLIGGGGGKSVANSDLSIREGLDVPALSEPTLEWLRRRGPSAGSIFGNPLDMWRTFSDPVYLSELLALAYKDPRVGMIVVDRLIHRKAFHIPESLDPNPQLIDFLKKKEDRKPTVVTVDSGGGDLDLASKGTALRAEFCKAKIPAYPSLQRAAKALFHLHHYHSHFVRT